MLFLLAAAKENPPDVRLVRRLRELDFRLIKSLLGRVVSKYFSDAVKFFLYFFLTCEIGAVGLEAGRSKR